MLPWLRAPEALRLHKALLEDSLRLLRSGARRSGATPFVSFSRRWNPHGRPGCEAIARAAAGMIRLPQSGSDLGGRLLDTFRRLFARGFRRVVVLGSDSPTLPVARLQAAFEALQKGDEVVLGPAEDGGYYLVGATRLLPAMFGEMPWGTDRVMRATLATLERHGVRPVLLEAWYDVDLPRDLERVRRAIEARTPGDRVPRRTGAFVDALVRDGRLPLRGRSLVYPT